MIGGKPSNHIEGPLRAFGKESWSAEKKSIRRKRLPLGEAAFIERKNLNLPRL
jgi:hypothetical protein